MSFTYHLARICILFILLIQQVHSQTLDFSYGNGDGLTTSNIGLLEKSKILSNNSVIVQTQVGIFYKFAKFDAQGNRDMSFGTAGFLYPYDQIGASGPQGHSNFIIDIQQRIIIGMYEFVNNQHYIKLKRYFQDGTPDTSFGTAGVFVYPIQAQAQIGSPTFSFFSDHSILLNVSMQGNNLMPSLLMKLTPDGILDTAFGENGIVINYVDPYNLLYNNNTLVIDGNDNIFLGYRTNGNPYNHFLIKFNSFGVPDQTFGIVLVDELTGYNTAFIWLYNGKIYLSARPINSINSLKIIRLNLDGTTDTGFNSIIIDQTNYSFRADSVAIDQFGKIITVGIVSNEAGTIPQKGVLKCYNVDGTLDTTFGNLGEVTFNYNWTHFLYPLIQSDNKIVVSGISLNSSLTGNNDWNNIFLRYTTNNNLTVYESMPSNSIALFPNPASTFFTISPDISEKVELYDVQGRLIRTYLEKSTTYSLDGLENGLFTLRIFTDSGIRVEKLLIN